MANVKKIPLNEFELWDKIRSSGNLSSISFELTARCNFNCRHCYINKSAADAEAQATELSAAQILAIADQAMEMGVLWCLLSGGEPLLRKDFAEIYIGLKKRGFLLTVFSNAALIKAEHIELFTKYPPRDLEITMYGATAQSFDAVTRTPGSFQQFKKALAMLQENHISFRLKAMLLQSNIHEFAAIKEFCTEFGKDYFRYDHKLNLRFDRDAEKNAVIQSERITAEQLLTIEQNDPQRMESFARECTTIVREANQSAAENRLFQCGVGRHAVIVGADGMLRLCSSLVHPDYLCDLRTISLKDGYAELLQRVHQPHQLSDEYRDNCGQCKIVNLCQWCPADAYLETGRLDGFTPEFCRVAHSRYKANF